MSLASPALTTTSFRKRKVKITKAMQEELERGWRERNVRLREMGLPKETLKQYTDWVHGRIKKEKKKTISNTESKKALTKSCQGIKTNVESAKSVEDNFPDSSKSKLETNDRKKPWITGPVSSKPSPTYTGTEMIGITVLHKSCLQPIFNKEAAEDAAKMRR
jgi:hypothetical protein